MIAEASITGLLKTGLIIVGAFLLLRFLGQFMIAKRNMEAERAMNESKRKMNSEREDKLKKFGKTTVFGKTAKSNHSNPTLANVEDVDFEEIE